MSDHPMTCAQCGSSGIRLRADGGQWVCDGCGYSWLASVPDLGVNHAQRAKLFLSYGRKDAEQLAERIDADLSLLGFDVWRDSAVSLPRLRGHEGWVTTIAFAADRRSVISGSGDGAVRVWDAATGVCLRVIERPEDVPPTAAECTLSRWRASDRHRQGETMFESSETGDARAWFPAGINPLTPDHEGRVWAGMSYSYVCIISIEGYDKAAAPFRGDRKP